MKSETFVQPAPECTTSNVPSLSRRSSLMEGSRSSHSFPRERSQHAIHFLLVTPSSCPSPLLLCSSHQFVRLGCGSSSRAACFPCCSLFQLIIHSTSIYLSSSTLLRITSSECSEYLIKWDSDGVRQRQKVKNEKFIFIFQPKNVSKHLLFNVASII